MQTIIDGLLTLVREENPPDKPIDIVPTIKGTIRNHLAEFSLREIMIEQSLPESFMVRAVPAHIGIIVSNFLRNALYHMEPIQGQPAKVTISISANKLIISDNGQTPPHNELKQAFNWGQRRPESRGTGLGLYIVSQIVSLHRWQIKAEPAAPNGSKFIVNFEPVGL
jgi:signal transduction histidine kinase